LYLHFFQLVHPSFQGLFIEILILSVSHLKVIVFILQVLEPLICKLVVSFHL
jgi:hypothetical protein